MTLQPHQQRVVDEAHELGERLAKLRAFIGTPFFYGLSFDEQARLVRQESAMRTYYGILLERIEAWV